MAPYLFRVAISNNRVLKLAEGMVTFRYRTTDTGKLKTCTLSAEEFIRRLLQHVLSKGQVRYDGFLSSGCRQRLAAIRQRPDSPLGGKFVSIAQLKTVGRRLCGFTGYVV